MNTTSSDLSPNLSASNAQHDRFTKHGERLRVVGTGMLRYGLVFLLVLFGAFKFFAFEAEGIKPLLSHSPFMSWLLALFGTRGASDFLGVFEITTALAIASRRFLPRVSAAGSLAASFMFLVTLSFLFTTPGVTAPDSEAGGFLMKDIMLLGAAVYTAGEALLAASPRATPRRAGGSS